MQDIQKILSKDAKKQFSPIDFLAMNDNLHTVITRIDNLYQVYYENVYVKQNGIYIAEYGEGKTVNLAAIDYINRLLNNEVYYLLHESRKKLSISIPKEFLA